MDVPAMKEQILAQLPFKFQLLLSKVAFEDLQEVRFRCGKPLMLYRAEGGCCIAQDGRVLPVRAGQAVRTQQPVLISHEDINALLGGFCENSVYAYQEEICDGFLTIRGGHRVGLCGRCVLTDGEISNIADISGFNLRIAREFIGCAQSLLPQIFCRNQAVANTILLAPPQCGKTTFLRDLTRLLSERFKVSLIDERSEIAAVKDGCAQLDVGMQTDVLDRFPKAAGMLLAVRSLSPEVMVTDELGSREDLAAVKSVLHTGCRIITSMHAESETQLRGEQRELYALFDKAVILTRRNGIPVVERVTDISV